MKTIFLTTMLMASSLAFGNGQHHISWMSLSANNRQAATVIVQNEAENSRVCHNLKVEATLQDPEEMMGVAMVYTIIPALFLYPKSDRKSFEELVFAQKVQQLNERTGKHLIIKEIILDDSELYCRPATLSDYCHLAQKDAWERLSLTQLAQNYGSGNCAHLVGKLSRDRRLNVEGKLVSDFRFLRFLQRTNRVYLANTYKDRSSALDEALGLTLYGRDLQKELVNDSDIEFLLSTLSNEGREQHETFNF